MEIDVYILLIAFMEALKLHGGEIFNVVMRPADNRNSLKITNTTYIPIIKHPLQGGF